MPDWNDIFKEHGYFFLNPLPEIERIASVFKENGVQRILDVGCGTGRHIVLLTRLGFHMTGFDSSSHALALCRKWLEAEGLNADIREHRMELKFPYTDASFDAVISTQVIHHNLLKDILFTISEIERIIRPGGLIFITVPVLDENPKKSKGDWCLRELERGTYVPESGNESGILHHYFTEDELLDAFNGFEPLEVFIDSTDHRCLLARKST
jgi:SAM-dependent methyltransferase